VTHCFTCDVAWLKVTRCGEAGGGAGGMSVKVVLVTFDFVLFQTQGGG